MADTSEGPTRASEGPMRQCVPICMAHKALLGGSLGRMDLWAIRAHGLGPTIFIIKSTFDNALNVKNTY